MNLNPATIRIKNLRLRTFIGINDDEIVNMQDVVINVKIQYRATLRVRKLNAKSYNRY